MKMDLTGLNKLINMAGCFNGDIDVTIFSRMDGIRHRSFCFSVKNTTAPMLGMGRSISLEVRWESTLTEPVALSHTVLRKINFNEEIDDTLIKDMVNEVNEYFEKERGDDDAFIRQITKQE